MRVFAFTEGILFNPDPLGGAPGQFCFRCNLGLRLEGWEGQGLIPPLC